MALVQELPRTPRFEAEDIIAEDGQDSDQDALWDVFFARISGVQEYGFHSGLEELMWATDQLNGPLESFDWPKLKEDLQAKSVSWTELIIRHAQAEDAFFPESPEDYPDDLDDRF